MVNGQRSAISQRRKYFTERDFHPAKYMISQLRERFLSGKIYDFLDFLERFPFGKIYDFLAAEKEISIWWQKYDNLLLAEQITQERF